ncbi:MAG: hypothetical protein IKE95_03495 [Methanobrevibacter sp.]|nr:hypothetical protein [Methanobrevibacter sp.]
MKEEDIKIRIKTIRKVFKDTRELEYVPYEPEMDGDLFTTTDGEIVYLDIQTVDFDAEELANYAEIAEELYEKYQKLVSIYLICPTDINVSVKECQIKSDANFSIKLARIGGNPIEDFLMIIKMKIMAGESLTKEDLELLDNIPMMSSKEERKKMRIKCFRLMNSI